jgi:tyrosine-protein phosphatase non-receptor type 4
MQYVAWPDHGVPDSPAQFLSFTEKVREVRKGDPSPVVVHCSAGIGRTGVLVLMETALCLIESGEPVYPLEIVKTMREQRAMMIQNAVSEYQPLEFFSGQLLFAESVQVRLRERPLGVSADNR